MNRLKAILFALLLGLSLDVIAANVYNYFAPGGALSCTGTCVTQSVDLTQSGFVSGPLRVGAGGTGTNSTLTGIMRGGNPVTATELSGDIATSGSNVTAIQANVVTNGDLALMAANTVKGNNTSGSANAADLTVAQMQSLLVIAASANPSAVVGLTTVNGSASTYLRSDAAPALSLAIAPNVASPWTSSPWVWSNAEPRHLFTESDQGTDLKTWDIDVQAGVFAIRTRTDADGAGVNALTATRGTTTAITNISLGNATSNPTFTYLGTGLFSVTGGASFSSGGTLSVGKVSVSNTTAPANGIYLNSANVLGFSANTTAVGSWNTTALTIQGALNAPNLATSSAVTTGTLCWTTGTGLVNVDTTTTCLLSTKRVKHAIQNLDTGLSEVMKLRPVSYELKPEFDPYHLGRQVGLISEEVENVDKRLISREQDGSPLGVRYQQLTALLVKAIQEQQAEIELLRKKRH